MSQHPIDRDQAIAFLERGVDQDRLIRLAGSWRDQAKGRTITYSRKVFIPLTTMCQDQCGYCTFAKPPGDGGEYLEPNQVLGIAQAGAQHRCTEALFTLGDRPEARWPQAAEFLSAQGHDSTISYLTEMSELVLEETGLFPHANPGLMSLDEIRALRPSNPSMGIMLESSSARLLEPGQAHYRCETKAPQLRIATIEAAAHAQVPFTTGILVGIGESSAEIVDSLLVLAELQDRWGHLNEIIVQNFRAKSNIRMRRTAEPVPAWFVRVVALARLLMGPETNIQVPPNLTESYEIYLQAGINDWGGVSPLTLDWVNPEAPWPQLEELQARTEAEGFELKPRLPVYPEFLTSQWIDADLLPRLLDAVDAEGYAQTPQLELVG